MTNFIILTDTHLSEKNHQVVFKLFQQIIGHCKTYQVDTIVHLGDVFDSRRGQPVATLVTWLEILNLLEKAELKLICLVGNHDKLDQTRKESFLEPFKTHKAMDLISMAGLRTINGLTLGLVSYFKPYAQLDLIKALELELGPSRLKKCILLTHADIVSFKMSPGKLATEGLSPASLKAWKHVFSGHYHDASSTGNISYLGASLQHTYGEAKVKGCHLITYQEATNTVEASMIMLDFPRYESIYLKSYDELSLIKEPPKELKTRICLELSPQDLALAFYELARLTELGYELNINKMDFVNLETDLEQLKLEVSLVKLLDLFCVEKKYDNFNDLKLYF